MKYSKLFLLCCFLCSFAQVMSQEYLILSVKGDIRIDAGKKSLKSNDVVKIKPTSKITFSSITDVLSTVYSDGTYIVFRPKKVVGKTNKEKNFTYIARNVLFPVRKKTSSRNLFPSLVSFLKENKVVALDDKIVIPAFKEDGKIFLFDWLPDLKFDFLRQMSYDSIKEIYSIKVSSQKETYNLTVRRGERSRIKVDMDVTFLSQEDLVQELVTIRNGLIKNKTPENEHDKFMSTYIQEHYGYLPKESVQLILKQVKEN